MSTNANEARKDINQLLSKFFGTFSVLLGNQLQCSSNFRLPLLQVEHVKKEILLVKTSYPLNKILSELKIKPIYNKLCLVDLNPNRFEDFSYYDYDEIKKMLSDPKVQAEFDLLCRAGELHKHFDNHKNNSKDNNKDGAGDRKTDRDVTTMVDAEEDPPKLNNLPLQKNDDQAALNLLYLAGHVGDEKPDVTMKPASGDKNKDRDERETFKARRKRG